jgi:hypothetical protein
MAQSGQNMPVQTGGAQGTGLATEQSPDNTVKLPTLLVEVMEKLVKMANCRLDECTAPFRAVVRRGAVDFTIKLGEFSSGIITIRGNVVTIEAGGDSVMVNGDFGTVSLIRHHYFLSKVGEKVKVAWDGTELIFTASEMVRFVKEKICEIIRRVI